MKKALKTEKMLPKIERAKEPTIEALNYYISQSDPSNAYKILSQTYEDKLIHSIEDVRTVYSIDQEEYAFYIFEIANIYLYQKKDYENAQRIYMDLSIYSPNQLDYIKQADMNIIRMLDIQGDKMAIKNYINDNILTREKLSKDYKIFLINILNEI